MTKTNLYHSCPEFLLRGHDYNVTVAVAGAVTDAVLVYHAKDEEKNIALDKIDCYSRFGVSYNVYGAIVPYIELDDLCCLKYHFVLDSFSSEEYNVKIESAGEMPPLAVTELYLRPKGTGITQFIEVVNPSGESVDLYDYKLVAYKGVTPSPEDYICGLNLADTAGKEIVKPGEVVVLWPLLPVHHDKQDLGYLSVDGFIAECMRDFPKPELDLNAERGFLRIIPVEASVYDEVQGKYVAVDNISNLPNKTEKTTLILATRDADNASALENAYYRMVYNKGSRGDRDTPVKYSSLWSIDVRKPTEGIVLSHRELMSPGKLGAGQALPDLNSPYLTIIPINGRVDIENTYNTPSIEFVIDDSNRCAAAYVDVKLCDGKYRRYRASKLEDNVWHVDIDWRDACRLGKLEYVITAYDGVRYTSVGTTDKPICTMLADKCGPAIIDIYPTEKYCYDNTRTPKIKIEYFDISGVDVEKSILCVDKKNVSDRAVWKSDLVTYTPDKKMKYGEHTYEIMLCDKLGNKTYRLVKFSICKPEELNFYRGEVHSHTAFSDGTATPVESYAYARDVGGVDFFAATEHSHYLDEELYLKQCDIADSYNEPGRFAAIYGYEMTWNDKCALWGHANVLNTKKFCDDIDGVSLPDLYEMFKNEQKAVGMFNHPCLHWGNFHDYTAYSEYADRFMCLSEIKGAGYDREYMNMLALGWHASPAFNEDNHGYNWTTATTSTTFALAPALTRENIVEAFQRRRTYSTTDPTMKIKFRINGEWMGARLVNPSVLKVDIDISTENEAGIGTIAIVTEDNIVVASVNAGALREYHWKAKLPPEFDYYYVRVTSAGKYTVTAPVWIEGRGALNIKALSYAHGESDYKPNIITAKIKNLASHDAKNVHVDFYLTASTGFDLERNVAYRSVDIPVLKSGKVACVDCNVPNIAGLRRVSAIVSGTCAGQAYADTAMVLLSPVKIAEILPKSPEVTDANGNLVANPFPYIKFCNLSNRDISLDKYYTRLWTTTGKQPSEDRTLKLDGNVIKAGGVLVVWVRPEECALSVDDFNKHYGTMLSEGEDLVITSIPAISSVKNSTRRLDLMCDKELMARIEYNFVQPPQTDINEGRAITYDVTPNMIGTSKMISNTADPSPSLPIKI